MKTDIPGVDWLLDCEPRLAQLEALARSYTGYSYHDHKDAPMVRAPLHHAGGPTKGWGHMLEMRVGKTPTLLNEFLLFRRDHDIRKAFVFTPNKYKSTWGLETERFGVDAPVHVFESTKRHKFLEFMEKYPDEGMVFVNYEALIQDRNRQLFERFVDSNTYMGADESIYIKNRQSLMCRYAMALSKEAAVTRPMSGKPTTQGVTDLYSQLRFARKINGWNYYQFRGRFAVMGGFKGKKVVGVKNEDKLHKLTQQCYFFARRADWGTSIDSDYEAVKLELPGRLRQAYKEMEEEFVAWLDSGEVVSTEMALTKHIKLQQITSGWIYDEYQEAHDLMPFDKTPKFIELADRMENYFTCKVIVVAHFTPTIDRLLEHFKEYQPAVIRGGEHMRKAGLDVDSEKQRFNEDPQCRMMIGQSKAIKYGHTLMGSPVDPCLATVYYENSYSLDDRTQSEQRNQGEGQQGAIHITDFVSSPIEANVIEALQRKEQVSGVILGYYRRNP